jgi:hypothetical protein
VDEHGDGGDEPRVMDVVPPMYTVATGGTVSATAAP